jgi:DNA-binding NtrC family response regulator
MVERLVVFCHDPLISADQIPADDQLASAYAERRRFLASANGNGNGAVKPAADATRTWTPMERHERAAIVDALRRVDGHVVGAARLLGLGQATVYRKIKLYGISLAKKRRRSGA